MKVAAIVGFGRNVATGPAGQGDDGRDGGQVVAHDDRVRDVDCEVGAGDRKSVV